MTTLVQKSARKSSEVCCPYLFEVACCPNGRGEDVVSGPDQFLKCEDLGLLRIERM